MMPIHSADPIHWHRSLRAQDRLLGLEQHRRHDRLADVVQQPPEVTKVGGAAVGERDHVAGENRHRQRVLPDAARRLDDARVARLEDLAGRHLDQERPQLLNAEARDRLQHALHRLARRHGGAVRQLEDLHGQDRIALDERGGLLQRELGVLEQRQALESHRRHGGQNELIAADTAEDDLLHLLGQPPVGCSSAWRCRVHAALACSTVG